jgi:hypothetical protein
VIDSASAATARAPLGTDRVAQPIGFWRVGERGTRELHGKAHVIRHRCLVIPQHRSENLRIDTFTDRDRDTELRTWPAVFADRDRPRMMCLLWWSCLIVREMLRALFGQ